VMFSLATSKCGKNWGKTAVSWVSFVNCVSFPPANQRPMAVRDMGEANCSTNCSIRNEMYEW